MRRTTRRAFIALFTAALVMLLSTCVLQETNAPLSGTLEFTFWHYESEDAVTPDIRTTTPIEGAIVNLKQYDAGSATYTIIATATTGSDGAFSFQSVTPGDYAADAVFTLDTSSSVSCYVEYSHDGLNWYTIECIYEDDVSSGTTQVTTKPVTSIEIASHGTVSLDFQAWGSNIDSRKGGVLLLPKGIALLVAV